MRYVNMNQIYHFGIDHLEIYTSFLSEEIFEGIDFDNSNSFTYGEYHCTKVENPRFAYQIVFAKNWVTLFSYFKWSWKGNITTRDYVAIYSSCFRTEGNQWCYDILLSHFSPPGVKPLRRFDICIDILSPISTILKGFSKLTQKGALFFGKDGNVETYYIGNKKSSENKRSLIRIYNKKEDIFKKWKNRLYQDYLLQDDITRVELEIRRELAQNYTIEELFVEDNLLGLMKNYLRDHTSLFEKLVAQAITLYRKPEEVEFSLIQEYSRNIMRVRMFLGHARWLVERGICPVYALLYKEIIHAHTKNVLKNSWEFLNLMKNMKEDAEHWTQILEKIKITDHDIDWRM